MGCRAQGADPSLSEISDGFTIDFKSRRGALSKLKSGNCVKTNQLRNLNLHDSDQQKMEVISFLPVKYFRVRIEGKYLDGKLGGVGIFSVL